MKIAFFHKDTWPPTEGSSLQSWQLFSRFQTKHTVYTPHTSPFPTAKHFYDDIWDAARLLKSVDVVFIIVDGPFYFFEEKFSILPTLLAIKKPVVWLLNAPIEESLITPGYAHYRYFFDKVRRRFFSSFVDSCICVSAELQTYAKKHLSAKKYQVIANGSDPDFFVPRPKLQRSRKEQLNVVWAGSGYYTWQAIDVICAVAKKMQTQDPSVMFTLVVRNSWYPLPRLSNLRVVKTLNYFQMSKFLQNADVALCLYHKVLASGFHNSPLKLFEAMSAGIPVIASDLGQIGEVIQDGKNGFLTTNNPDEIISKIEYIKQHPQIARHIGIRARKTILTTYNWDRMATEINSIFSKLTSSRL